MSRLFVILYCLLLVMTADAQKAFTLEDLIPGGHTYSNFTPKTEWNYRWYGDELLAYNDAELKGIDSSICLTREELQGVLGSESVGLGQIGFVLLGDRLFASVSTGEKRVFFDLKTKEIELEIPIRKEWKNVDFCSENRSIAFTEGNSLYVSNADSQPFIIGEGSPGIVYGQSVHRDEFGIRKGTFWSPNGNYLAFYRMDESGVADYPLVGIPSPMAPFGSEPVEARLKAIKYPMAGQTSHEVTLGVYHLQSGSVIYLNTEEPKDHYLTNIAWDPSERFVYIAEINRGQDHLQLNKYDVASGEKVATLFEERSDRYVEPQVPMQFLKTKPKQFVWQSQRDGYNHLYLYDTSGKLIRQLTSGEYPVGQVYGFDKKEEHLFFQSNEESPIDYQIYRVNLKTGKKSQLTFEEGIHRGAFNASGTRLIDRHSNQYTPLNVNLIEIRNSKIGKTTPLASAPNPYEGYLLPEIMLGTLKAADDETDLYYRLVKPIGFDAKKKYPVVVYVYGGPHSQSVSNSWLGGTRGWDIYMAQKGYLVFTMDNRGTSNRGFEFESIIHRKLGYHEVNDQMKGIELLQSLPYVDVDRIGVHGWSYGGFMTTNLMLRHPNVFKVGVAGGPVIDWSYYEVMYGERYMDTPVENPEGYAYSDMNNLAKDLKGRFLIIHGDEDPTVVLQHSLSFLKACIDAGTHPDYFIYPGQGHNMVGRSRVHLHEKITQYFNDNL